VGELALPTAGMVYLDAAAVIYSVEQIAPYDGLLAPLWQAASAAQFVVVSSELTLLEVLVKPVREGKQQLVQRYRTLLTATSEVHLAPIDRAILDEATRIRASHALKTPDAIHAATALRLGCALFVTNDPAFRRVPGLPVTVLDDHLTP
jgi:predicted nucleic acid-binding protein